MDSPIALAEQIFDIISFSINQACKEHDWYDVRRDALAFRFIQSDTYSSLAQVKRFDLTLEPNIDLILNCSLFPISSAPDSRPASISFELSLLVNKAKVKSHVNGFDSLIYTHEKSNWNELSFI